MNTKILHELIFFIESKGKMYAPYNNLFFPCALTQVNLTFPLLS
jgi:hypothetical protein